MTTYIALHDGTWTTITSWIGSDNRPNNRTSNELRHWAIRTQICEDFSAQGIDEEIMVTDVIKVVDEIKVESLGLSFTFDPENWE